MDLAKYERIFTQESEKYLRELDDLLMRVERDLINRHVWSEIHGKVHSIKGMARALSLIQSSCFLMEQTC
jgi:two-component system chemotaxis sensor kinase CheA